MATACPVRPPTLAEDTKREASPSLEHWHYGYRWFNNEPERSAAGSCASPAAWSSGLRAPRWPGPAPRPGEPSFTRAQVAACDGSGPDGRILVTYRDGVYDVTEYIKEHPGRNFILNAAGGPVDPWWGYWMQHHVSPLVAQTLERLRVGKLADYAPLEDEARSAGGLWAEEQLLEARAANRHKSWRITEMPYMSVTKCAELVESFLTPSDAFYVRNHGPVPAVAADEADEHSVTFCVDGAEVAELSLAELRAGFEMVQVTSIMQCAGNRAADNIESNGTTGNGFAGSDDEFIGVGMLGNGRWRGVRLADVLRAVLPDNVWQGAGNLHATFEGLDGYYTSTPLAHIMNRAKDCLLATEMNGEPLTPDHGFPVRVLLPGVAGARHVKWLSKVTIGPLSDDPWTQHYYRDMPSGCPIQELPMNSVILSPEPGSFVEAGATTVHVRGVAYGGGTDSEIAKVEVSADRGQSWQEARCLFGEIDKGDAAGAYRGWVRFEASVPLPRAQGLGCGGPLPELWCRTFDGAGRSQPERSPQRGGYLYNGYHKVPIVRR